MRGKKKAIACLGRAKLLQAAETGQPAVCLCFGTAEAELVRLELSSDAGCKGFLAWMPHCANEAVLPGDLRCSTHVVLYHAVWSYDLPPSFLKESRVVCFLHDCMVQIGRLEGSPSRWHTLEKDANNAVFMDALRWGIQGSRFPPASGLQNQQDCFITNATFGASYTRCLSYEMLEDVPLSSLS